MVHGSALLLGTAVVALGFVFGVVYVVQSRRPNILTTHLIHLIAR